MPPGEESRLLDLRVLQNFVRETRGKWDEESWKALVGRIRRIGFESIPEERLARLAEDNRERWLAGRNDLGPPPPAPVAPPQVAAVLPAPDHAAQGAAGEGVPQTSRALQAGSSPGRTARPPSGSIDGGRPLGRPEMRPAARAASRRGGGKRRLRRKAAARRPKVRMRRSVRKGGPKVRSRRSVRKGRPKARPRSKGRKR